MRERLRAFLNRPIESEAERRTAMIAATVVVVGAAVLFLVLFGGQDDGKSPAGDRAPSQPRAPERGSAGNAQGAGQPVAPPAVPLPSQVPSNPPKVGRSAKASAQRAGRRFAESYLRFQRRKGSKIAAATSALRRQIAREPRGRVSPAAAEHPPKVVGIDAQVVDRDTIVVTATVARLGARFPLRATATKGRGGWVVSALQTEG